ncbi:MAG: hypothetical protein ACTFAL_16120 [Candidatus Electronema sp. V4]|uniref:hypothetical protein n=1 Tax=Candidatus Electronema sp. V4 TaxID=3454756 RepID=UPI00405580A8
MTLLERYQHWGERVMRIFRFDLQTHFFWGFALTLLGVYWPPLYLSGLAVNVIKEALDLWSKQLWSWDDVVLGTAGWLTALGYLHSLDLLVC